MAVDATLCWLPWVVNWREKGSAFAYMGCSVTLPERDLENPIEPPKANKAWESRE